MMWHLEDPHYAYFWHHFLVLLHQFLTRDWWIIQGKEDQEALRMWLKVGRLLELDRKSLMDLIMLAQVIPVGRTKANKIMWDLMTGPALEVPQRDMSHMVTSQVFQARKTMDRPPREHRDLERWDWSCYWTIPRREEKWACHIVPEVPWVPYTEHGEKPVPPPKCFVKRSSMGPGQQPPWNTWA